MVAGPCLSLPLTLDLLFSNGLFKRIYYGREQAQAQHRHKAQLLRHTLQVRNTTVSCGTVRYLTVLYVLRTLDLSTFALPWSLPSSTLHCPHPHTYTHIHTNTHTDQYQYSTPTPTLSLTLTPAPTPTHTPSVPNLAVTSGPYPAVHPTPVCDRTSATLPRLALPCLDLTLN